MVGIETMAHSRPIVATACGATGEWLTHGRTGALVERGNVKELADWIETLLLDEDLARGMGERGLRLVDRSYRSNLFRGRILKAYNDVI